MSASPVAIAEREWRRFTPRESAARFAVYLAIIAAVVA
jgi:hypothetical protein